MDLDEETRALLGFAVAPVDLMIVALEARSRKRREAIQRYEDSAKGRRKRAEYNALHRTRPQRKARAKVARMKKVRTEPALRGYARIKAWREKNPAKYAAIQKRYEKSAKRKVVKSRSNKKHHEKRKAR